MKTIKTAKLRKMGGSVGLTFPKEMLDGLGLQEGDEVNLIQTSSGIEVSPFDPGFDRAMAIFERGARQYRNALRELAK